MRAVDSTRIANLSSVQPAVEQTLLPRPRRPLALVVGLLAAGFVALSIHVVMLAAGVPFPIPRAPLWARWLHLTLIVSGTLAFLRWTAPGFGRLTLLKRTLITFVTIAMLQETLRATIMPVVVTGGWLQPVIALVAPLVRTLVIAALCVVASRWVRGGMTVIIAAPFVAAAGVASNQALGWMLSPILQYASRFARDDLYAFPYPFHVTVAAYVTFVEAVAGAALMTIVVWNQLPGSRMTRFLVLAGLAALIKGVVGGTFVFGFFTGSSAPLGIFSWSQFLFEFLALGFLVGLVWDLFGERVQPAEIASTQKTMWTS